MNDILRERLIRKLDTLPEEKIYQILDYIDFLESKYAPKLSTAPNPLKRFAEGVEDTLRAGKMSAERDRRDDERDEQGGWGAHGRGKCWQVSCNGDSWSGVVSDFVQAAGPAGEL